MAKVARDKAAKKAKFDGSFPLERENYMLLGIGLVLIVFGYIALSGDKVEGFVPLTLAPILLLVGYCVVIPLGIMYRKKEKKTDQPSSSAPTGA